jgi:hypothetical protein
MKRKLREKARDMEILAAKECSFKPHISSVPWTDMKAIRRGAHIHEYLFADAKTRSQRLDALSNLRPSFCSFQPRLSRLVPRSSL